MCSRHHLELRKEYKPDNIKELSLFSTSETLSIMYIYTDSQQAQSFHQGVQHNIIMNNWKFSPCNY